MENHGSPVFRFRSKSSNGWKRTTASAAAVSLAAPAIIMAISMEWSANSAALAGSKRWTPRKSRRWSSEEASSVVTNLDVASQVPPIRTRTWFHTGAYRQGDRISRHLEDEYYGAPQPGEPNFAAKRRTFEATLLDDTVLPSGLTLNEEREACRALKGVMLRQEIYAEDAPEGASEERAERAKIPYTVTEQNFTVERVQARSGDRDGVFVVHPRETLSYHYERQPEAPRIGHALTLKVDSYGNALRTMAISYGRTSSLLTEPADQEKQTQTLITYTENRVTKAIDDAAHPDDYHTPLAAETFTYELTGLKPETNGVRFSFDEFTRNNFAALNSVQEIQYEERADSITKQKRLIERIRTLYRKDDLTVLLTLGDLDPLTLPGENYKLAFTPGLLAQTYKRTVGPGPEEDLLPIPKVVLGGNGPDAGGYVDLDANGHWWIPSGRVFFDAAADLGNPSSTAVTELAEARKHFYVARLLADPFAHRGRIDYDPHDLLVVRTEDALQNSVAANYDYRVLQPQLTSDPNGNRSAAAYDALGMVVATALMGKAAPAPTEGDLLEGFDPDPPLAALQAFTTDPLAHADSLLGKATARLVYDLERFQRCGQPPFSSSLVRETHFSEAAGAVPMIQVSFSYSDGFGREIQKKIQAEPGPAPRRASMVPLPLGDMAPGALLRDVAGQVTSAPTPLRWVGTGRTVFNNKGKPVRQYEPFFSSTHLFEAEREMTDTGVTPILFYDSAERLVATVHPDHSWEKMVFDGWEQTVYDVNDTLQQADGTTDPKFDKDVQGFFSRLLDADYLPTWLEQRRSLPAGDPERLAAEKATVHHQTPATSHLDALGRPFLTIAGNRFVRGGRVIEESYASRVELDIEGHQRAVRDAIEQNGDRLGRLVMRYDYNMLGHLIRQSSMEAGERWMLSDVTGKAIRAWDSRGFARRIAYDELRRAIGLFVAQNGTERLAERTLYGEGEGTATNHRTRVHQAFDGAGVVTSEAYDFKGNLLRSRRELLPDYIEAVDWKLGPTPNAGLFRTSKTYDALNRPVTVTSPDGSLYRPAFNEANLLNKVEVNLRGAAAVTPFVTNIDYDAKGRRELIAYGNGAVTTYQYDPLTLRLIQLQTRRPAGLNGLASKLFNDGAVVQDLHYTYDPAGNITRITDSSLARLSAAGPADNAPRDYTYDALYRLIEATGREHTGQTARVFAPPDGNFRDYPFSGLANYIAHPNDLQAMRLYTEKYEYDAAGNFQFMRHVAESGNWSRSYQYQAASLTEPTKRSNRLTKSIIGNGATFDETYDYADSSGLDTPGCMTAINNLRMTWDDKDQLHKVDLGGGGTAYYVFDGTGQRTRKVIETAVGTRAHERIYLGGFEIYREYDALGTTIELERESLHLMDDQQRVALVETKTRDAGVPIATPLSLVRYQIGNHLGSSSLELDASGAIISYEEYFCYGSSSLQAGRTAAEASLKRYRFTGKERDEETGFSYHRARFLAPWLGRWVSSDPSGLEDGLNVFSYARNNPVILSDPDGRQSRVDPNDPRVKALAAATPRRQSLQADAGRKGPLQSFHLKGAHKGTPGGAGNAHQPSAPKKEGKPGGTDAVTKAGEAGGNSDHSQDGKAEPPKSGTGETKAGGSKTNLVGGHGDLQNQTAAKTELDYAALLAGYINFEFGSEKGGVQSGGIPGGKGEDKNASPAGQSLYAALALLDLIGAAKAIYGVGKAILKHTIGTIGARIAGDRALREGLKELTEAEARRLAAQQVAKKASVPIEKFSEYIFKEGADHGKDAVFRGLGYGKEHSAQLAKIWEEQGAEKFAKGEYTLGKLDQYGQRINISIEVPGIGDAAGKTSYMQSGWMIRPDGSITLNTPFSGFTK